MKNGLIFRITLAVFIFSHIMGCSLNDSGVDGAPFSGKNQIQTVVVAGKVEFPSTSGSIASIKGVRGAVNFTRLKVYINGKSTNLNGDGSYSHTVDKAELFDIQVKNSDQSGALLRCFVEPKNPNENSNNAVVNVESTAKALVFESLKQESNNQDLTLDGFNSLIGPNNEKIKILSETIENSLKSNSKIENGNFDFKNEKEVADKIKENIDEAKKNENKLVVICHIPPGNFAQRHTIKISPEAVSEHLNQHGDTVGACPVESSTTTTTTTSTTTTTGVITTSTSTTTSTSNSGTASSTTSTVKPSATLSISSGATYATTLSVILNISGVTGTGNIEMSIDGGAFETFNAGKSYTLPAGEGTKTVKVVLRDSTGNVSLDITDTIILDTIPPAGTNTNIVATSTASVSGTIRWITSEATFGRVEYGTSAGSLSLNTTETGATTTHLVFLTGLTASTTYFYKPTSADAAGNRIGTATFSFSTPNAGQIWNSIFPQGNFPLRTWHTSVVYNGYQWVIGGYDGIGKNDVRRSQDGNIWEQVTSSVSFLTKLYHPFSPKTDQIFSPKPASAPMTFSL